MRGGPPRTPTAGNGRGPSAFTMTATAPSLGASRTDRTTVSDARAARGATMIRATATGAQTRFMIARAPADASTLHRVPVWHSLHFQSLRADGPFAIRHPRPRAAA